ncbi:MAG TPA: cobalamin-dependent protein [Anaerolineaceae bacterium]|jgi:5-methyltetrahydrofolate--homocysteine methyltransferase
MSEKLINAIAEMDEDQAQAIVKDLLAKGTDPLTILDDCRAAMDVVGKRFEKGEYFIPELILAGEMLKSISLEVKPLIAASAPAIKKGKVMVGTVAGDIHDIAKDIVVFMLDVNGFEVKDLGVDVPVATFVSEAKSWKPDIVALSGFLTLAYTSMKDTVDGLKAAGVRDHMKVMIGGGTIDENVCSYAGADAYGRDAMTAVALANKWMGVN